MADCLMFNTIDIEGIDIVYNQQLQYQWALAIHQIKMSTLNLTANIKPKKLLRKDNVMNKINKETNKQMNKG